MSTDGYELSFPLDTLPQTNSTMSNLSQHTKLILTLAIQAAAIVWWASNLSSRVQHNDYQIKMVLKDIEKNSEFVKLWPAGKWGSGSLPDDVKQNLKIDELQRHLEKMMDDLYTLGPRQ